MPLLISVFAEPYIPLVLSALILLLFFIVILQGLQLGRMKKKQNKFFTSGSGQNLEESLLTIIDQLEETKNKQTDQQFLLNRLTQRLSQSAGNLAVIRYNAFGDTGSDLSFSLALIDDNQNGVVVTSIYGREESRTYAKPLEAGKSIYNLSEEELAAIKKASQAPRS